jgi:hypothetical protein
VVARNLFRIAAVAVGLSTLSFAAGVAGDLSMADPPNYGERVILRLPPEISADSVRAAPLPALISTSTATAAPRSPRRGVDMIRVIPVSVDHLVTDAGPALVNIPKLGPLWLGKPQLRAKPV